MKDIQDFIKEYYGVDVTGMLSLEEFELWKAANSIEEWDYPLEEYSIIAENGLKCVPVRFRGYNKGYEYRFCEVEA